MQAFSSVPGRSDSRVVITCEHASNDVPSEYGSLGVSAEALDDHIAWDVGAGQVALLLAQTLSAPAVLSRTSRLVIDCNRGEDEADLIVEVTDGVQVPANVGIDSHERMRRLDLFHRPYHGAIDAVVAQHERAMVLSIHSFTPMLRAPSRSSPRDFDIGVLFDDHDDRAERLGRALVESGLTVRYNEPYSGLAGLIFSARSHGRRHVRPYLELEVNNGLVHSADGAQRITRCIATALGQTLEEE